jgi:cobalamin biosynthesis protein CobT
MKGELFTHEVSKTSSIFGRKKSVNVVFQGEQACTDGSTIILPSLDLTGDVSDSTADVIRGYVDHEAGHVRHTDFDALRVFGDECQRTNNNLLRAIHNALEDVWLERRVIEEYPGAQRNLVATSDAVNREFLDNVPAGDARLRDDKFVSAVALTWEGRKDYGGDTCGQCLDLLDAGLRTALGNWVSAVGGCKTTTDVIALAREVERQLKTGEHREQPQQPQGTPSADGEQGNDGQGDAEMREPDGDATGDGQGSSEQPMGEGDADAQSDGGDAPSGEGEGDNEEQQPDGRESGVGPKGGGEDNAEVYEDFDLSRAVNKALGEDGLTDTSKRKYRPMSTAHDKWHHRTDKPRKYGTDTLGQLIGKGKREHYEEKLEATAGATNIMRRKLERALMAKQNRDWDSGREHGRLDSRRLASAYAGKANVFKMLEQRPEVDTALMMLVDLSGSMRGREAHLATLTTIAMAEAIDRTGIAYEVLGFNNRTGWLDDVPRPNPYKYDESGHILRSKSGGYLKHKYHRTDPLDMYIFKAFEERLNEAKGAMDAMSSMAGGDNSDGEAVLNAFDRLRNRPEKRKVMIVFSDGQPISGGDYGWGAFNQHLRDVVRDITDAGVDLIGVGICDDNVSRFYPQYVVVNDVDDLAGQSIDMMAKALMGEGFVVDNSKLLDAS